MAQKESEIARREEILVDLYEEYYERVARYIFVRIGDPHEAEDLASEAFVRALKSLDSYEERGLPMTAWIFRIAHNLVVDHFRKESKRQIVRMEGLTIADPSDPEEIAGAEAQVEELRRALQVLTPAQREVIALRFFSGLDSNDCARILGRKPGAVREMQSAAIKSLRQVLSREIG